MSDAKNIFRIYLRILAVAGAFLSLASIFCCPAPSSAALVPWGAQLLVLSCTLLAAALRHPSVVSGKVDLR